MKLVSFPSLVLTGGEGPITLSLAPRGYKRAARPSTVPQQLDAASSSPQPSQEAVGERQGLDPLDEAVRLHDLAVSRRTDGRFQEAVVLCRQALAIIERVVGLHHPDVANVLNSLAGMYVELGDYTEAEHLAQRSVAMMEEMTGGIEMEVLRVQSLGTLAGIYRMQGRYADAEPLFRRALALAKTALEPKDLEVATCLNNFAVLSKYTGRFAAAQRFYRRALAIVERALGPDHPEVAAIYHNLGGLEHARGRFARGEPYARRAVAIREKALGPDHPDVAADIAALAAILDGQGKFEEAEALYRRALTIFERVMARTTPRWPSPATTWQRSRTPRATMPRPSASTSAPWRSRRRSWGRSTRMWP